MIIEIIGIIRRIIMNPIKKFLAVMLTLAMVITIAPVVTPVKAGEGVSLKDITTGVNSNGTVNAGGTIKINRISLLSKVPSDLYKRLGNKQAYFEIQVKNTENGEAARTFKVYVNTNEDYISISVNKNDAGKWYSIFIEDPGYTGYSAETYKVVGQSGGSSSSGSKKNSSSGKTTVTIFSSPELNGMSATLSYVRRKLTVYINGNCEYEANGKNYYTAKKIVKLYKGKKLIATKKTNGTEAVFKKVKVRYGKTEKFKVKLFVEILKKNVERDSRTYKVKPWPIPKAKLFATKISKKKAYLRWTKISDVSGYYIYQGKKLVKKIKAKKNMCMIKRKKAGSSKYKVAAFVKDGKKIYKVKSKKAKPKKNQAKWSINTNVKNQNYATCKFAISKISLSGKTYTVTGYALNNRLFKMKKYKKLKIVLRVDGKIAFKKTFKNKKVNAKDTSAKKLVLKIKGKAGKDLAHGSVSVSTYDTPDWGKYN